MVNKMHIVLLNLKIIDMNSIATIKTQIVFFY